MTELSQLKEGLKMLDHLSGNSRKAARDARALTRQVLGLGYTLSGLTAGRRRGLDPLVRDLADLPAIAGRAGKTLESAFGSAFSKLMIKGGDFKSVLKGLEGDLLKLGHQVLGSSKRTTPSTGTNNSLLTGAISSLAGMFPGFANGGAFTVGGAAGTDRNLVGLRLTRGEKVTVQTPQQQRKNDHRDAAPTINLSFHITTPDADSFRRSQAQIQGDALRAAQRQLKRNG
ncbi:hypothetical protein NBZ79_12165 [Sneathiella marina]|uniref:Tail protein n=1 Tax=Sneathiella marina TaxID=2950108 RepID=A0ABY4VYD0_9PROT|nr:hypothetical protein [Sneathiella marina]USG59931.1 hypothetical protein NBZ79_12165 [Sneathiella marina]